MKMASPRRSHGGFRQCYGGFRSFHPRVKNITVGGGPWHKKQPLEIKPWKKPELGKNIKEIHEWSAVHEWMWRSFQGIEIDRSWCWSPLWWSPSPCVCILFVVTSCVFALWAAPLSWLATCHHQVGKGEVGPSNSGYQMEQLWDLPRFF